MKNAKKNIAPTLITKNLNQKQNIKLWYSKGFNVPFEETKTFQKKNSGLIFDGTKHVLKDFKDKVFPRSCANID